MRLAEEIRLAGRVYLIGNGGSYANAVHISNDLNACGIRAFTLDPATLTATANDFSYKEIFARWLRTVGEPRDVLIALSGSGASPNILAGIREARRIGMWTCAIVGDYKPQGDAAILAHYAYRLGTDMQSAENAQLMLGHKVMKWLKNKKSMRP